MTAPGFLYSNNILRQHRQGVLEIVNNRVEQFRTQSPVNHPVIHGHSDGHDGRHAQGAIGAHNGTFFAGSDRENGPLRRVNYRLN